MHSVLIVDDEKVEAGILGEILTHEGFDVTTQTDPRASGGLGSKAVF